MPGSVASGTPYTSIMLVYYQGNKSNAVFKYKHHGSE